VSVTDGLKATGAGPAMSRSRWMRANVVYWLDLFRRPPRAHTAPAWRAPLIVMSGGIAAVAVIVATMVLADAWAIMEVRRLPQWLVAVFDELTDFGKSGWFLVPIALFLLLIAALASPALPRVSRLVLAAVSVRLGFLFVAIAVPALVVAIAKRLIGRARPLVDGNLDPFVYLPFAWRVDYASLPSGHATNACAAAFAIGALWPRARWPMWAYALVIGISRVVLTSHHPSDVVAGAVAGVVGALIVRDWFAARRLGFAIDGNGHARALPGPSYRRIKRVARQIVAP
jgi:membrane-associated phospholipid phosphatase